jgi:predicted NodU family carbamoyl transferase
MLVLGLSVNFSDDYVYQRPNSGGPSIFAFHDGSACLIRDGELLAAVEEEPARAG